MLADPLGQKDIKTCFAARALRKKVRAVANALTGARGDDFFGGKKKVAYLCRVLARMQAHIPKTISTPLFLTFL